MDLYKPLFVWSLLATTVLKLFAGYKRILDPYLNFIFARNFNLKDTFTDIFKLIFWESLRRRYGIYFILFHSLSDRVGQSVKTSCIFSSNGLKNVKKVYFKNWATCKKLRNHLFGFYDFSEPPVTDIFHQGITIKQIPEVVLTSGIRFFFLSYLINIFKYTTRLCHMHVYQFMLT